MSELNHPIEAQALLANAAFVRALAASLVFDEHAVDDVVQETWLAALQHPPGPRWQLRSWLAGVARHLALQVGRRNSRRLRRELAAARPEATASAADAAASWEAIRSVVDAVEELEPRYRTVVLLRYFEDLSLRAIAQRLAVPLETARTRLRRALEQLRTRLDREHRGDRKAWSAALLPIADPLARLAEDGAAGVLGSVFTVALFMTLKTKLGVLAALLIAAAGTIYLGVAVLSGPQPITNDADSVAAARGALVPSTRTAPGETEPTSESARRPLQPPDTAARLAVIHGRCIAAETGAPLTGCEVRLQGGDTRAPELAKDSPGERWEDPPAATTGADGLFRFAFPPHPTIVLTIYVRSQRRCSVTGSVAGAASRLAPGEDVNLGDVPLWTGARVTGQVVEPGGAPVAQLNIFLQLQDGRASGLFPAGGDWHGTSSEDGSFELVDPVPPGTFSVVQHGERARDLVAPKTVFVKEGQATATLRVVVQDVDPEELITGTVVDETGAPPSDFFVEAVFGVAGRTGRGVAGARGSFEIRRDASSDGRARIRVWADGFDPLLSEQSFAWGTRGIRLTLHRMGAAEILVVAAETGRPIEDFALRSHLSGDWSAGEAAVRLGGHHENGRVLVSGVKAGWNLLRIFAADKQFLPSDMVVFEKSEGLTPQIRVELHRPVVLSIRVVRKDGSPVSGSRLSLLQLTSPDIHSNDTFPFWANQLAEVVQLPIPMALRLDAANTDAAGRARLKGPPARDLVLYAPGPGHAPLVQKNVTLVRDGSELTLVVGAGATLRGRIAPASLVARLTPSEEIVARYSAKMDREDWLAAKCRGLVLVRDRTSLRLPIGPVNRFRLAPDGSFHIENIPPGTWNLRLGFTLFDKEGSAKGVYEPSLVQLGDLKDGETRELKLDASRYVPAQLTGRVFLDGEPFRSAKVALIPARPDLFVFGSNVWANQEARTDKDGSFAMDASECTYVLQLEAEDAARGFPVRTAEEFRLDAGGAVEREFRLIRSKAIVKILASDGKTPVRGRRLRVFGEGSSRTLELKTAADGTVVIDPAPSFPFRLQLLPEDIDQETSRELAQRGITLGPLEVRTGDKEARFELTLPPAKK